MEYKNRIWELKFNPHHSESNSRLYEECIELQCLGLYMYNKQSYGYHEHEVSHSLKELFSIAYSDSLLQNAKIYRFPKLTLPRDKVKILCDKYNAKVVRDIEVATLAVLSLNYMDNLTDHTWGKSCVRNQAESFKKFEEGINKNVFTPGSINKIETFLNNIGPEDKVRWYNASYYWSKDVGKIVKDYLSSLEIADSSGYMWYIKNSEIPKYHSILKHKDKLVWDTDLNKSATSDSLILNSEYYSNIIKMISSSDQENVTMGLEIMANCNSEESKTFLSLLFYFHSNELKNCKSWNHVNFKALKNKYNKYINTYGFHYVGAFDQIVKHLIEDNALTEFAVNTIACSLFKNVFEGQYGVKANSVFKIDPSSLILRDEFSKKILSTDINKIKYKEESPLPF